MITKVAIIIAALCSPAAADWQQDARDEVSQSQCADCRWSLVVLVDNRAVVLPGYDGTDSCMAGGRWAARTASAAVTWFCLPSPAPQE